MSSSNWVKVVLDLLFPPRCVGCKKRGIWLCPDCISSFPRVKAPICRICGCPTRGTQICVQCYKTPLRIQGVRAPYYFEGVLREAIHRFKYRHARHLAEPLARILADYLSAEPIEADVIVPVPLHETRAKERGYNQSELLAIELGKILNVPVSSEELKRERPTKAQMSLPAAERVANVRGAFSYKGGEFFGNRILLIDDVCTTGATLEACSLALQRGGAKLVWGLCVARARLDRQLTRVR